MFASADGITVRQSIQMTFATKSAKNRHSVYNLFFAGGLRPRECSSALSGTRHLFGLDHCDIDVLKRREDAHCNEGDKPTDMLGAS
jgi:hypothetical protein